MVEQADAVMSCGDSNSDAADIEILPPDYANSTGIIPTEFKVLVLPDEVPDITSGGILVPNWCRDQRQSACVTGRVVAMADEAFSFVEDDARIPDVGERVAFAKYAGMAVKGKDRKVYKLMNDKDVAAILDFPFDAKDYQF